MTKPIIVLVGALLSITLVGPGLAGTGGPGVEAEDGIPLQATCLEGQEMRVVEEPSASGGAYLFFSAMGCTAVYQASGFPTAVRFRMGGHGGILCGGFVLSGAATGSTPVTCAPPGQWVVAPIVGATAPTGPFSLTWRPDIPVEPTWIDANVDVIHTN